MIDDPVLLNDWYIVAAARDLADKAMLPVRLWDEDLVIWRHGGQVMAWKDYCIHRGAKLSLGRIADGTVECPYHGWSFDGGGQCQRVAVARALVNDPALILADEPTGALDHSNAESLADLLVELNRDEKVTLIVVTHSTDLAARMGTTHQLQDGTFASNAA